MRGGIGGHLTLRRFPAMGHSIDYQLLRLSDGDADQDAFDHADGITPIPTQAPARGLRCRFGLWLRHWTGLTVIGRHADEQAAADGGHQKYCW